MEGFNDIINSSMPVLVDFHAEWCSPCKAMSPVVKEVAQALQGKARVIKVDIDQSSAAAQAYQVQAVPTFIVFRNGKIVWRHSGMIDKNSLLQAVTQEIVT
ncbi:MAG TPA: thioredoxin [Chitinophagaceae bacterium]|nr:thioredoxin [Chitinophagaceae bacterium]